MYLSICLGWWLFCNTICVHEQQDFPKKLPMSQSVPQIYTQVKEFIYASLKFSESLHRRYHTVHLTYTHCLSPSVFVIVTHHFCVRMFFQFNRNWWHAEKIHQPAADENAQLLSAKPHQKASHWTDWGSSITCYTLTKRRVFFVD